MGKQRERRKERERNVRTWCSSDRERRDGGMEAAEGKQRIREAVMPPDREEDTGNGEKMETNDAGSRSGLMGRLGPLWLPN